MEYSSRNDSYDKGNIGIGINYDIFKTTFLINIGPILDDY